jgi:hypothetical protein
LSFSVILILTALIQTLTGEPAEKTKVTICVYDHSGLKAGTLAQAEKEADRIFCQAGVETEWRDLPTSEVEADGKTNVLEQLGPTGFVLKILPKSMTEHLQIRDAALGYSIPCPEDGSACIANILYDRVQDLAQSENVSLSKRWVRRLPTKLAICCFAQMPTLLPVLCNPVGEARTCSKPVKGFCFSRQNRPNSSGPRC